MYGPLSRAIYYRYFSKAFSVPGLERYTSSASWMPSSFVSKHLSTMHVYTKSNALCNQQEQQSIWDL